MTDDERKKLASEISTAVVLKACLAVGAAIVTMRIIHALLS